MQDIPGCNVAPGLSGPRQAAYWLICSRILGLMKNLSSLERLLLMACAKGQQTLRSTKNSKFSFRAASTLKQF